MGVRIILKKAVMVTCVLCTAAVIPLPSGIMLPNWRNRDMLVANRVLPAKEINADLSARIADEINLPGLKSSGFGVRVDLIDTGVDPLLIPSLVNFVDLTGEGSITTSQAIMVTARGTVSYAGKTYDVSGIKTKSGKLRVGYFRPAEAVPYDAPSREMLSHLGEVPLIVADNYLAGQYDTVYLDSNLNGSFADEKGLEVFRNSRLAVCIRPNTLEASLDICVSDILDNGQIVVLGFDGHGHGTSVASIISGNNKNLVGVAPAARLSIIKAADSSGRSTWGMLAQAINRALQDKPQVIVLALAPDSAGGQESPEMVKAIKAVQKQNALLVMAAGNLGPGLSTLSSYAEQDNVVTVGGYVPQSVAQSLSWALGGNWYPWSSAGPTKDGATVSLIAPALAPALLPSWEASPDKAYLFEGTSCSAAFVGGASAVLAEESASAGARFSGKIIEKALEDGAKYIPSIEAVLQGRGLLDVGSSVGLLGELKADVRVRTVYKWEGNYTVKGFFDRNKFPGYIPLTVDNLSTWNLKLTVHCPEWLSIPLKYMSLPPVEYRSTSISTDTSLQDGLYSGWVLGDDPSVAGVELSSLVTVIRPKDLGLMTYTGLQTILSAGNVHREYIKVPRGLETLSISASIIDTSSGRPRGKIDVYVYNPSGVLTYHSGWIGRDCNSEEMKLDLRLPFPGVWEICVVSDYVAGIDTDAVFKLQASASGIIPKSDAAEIIVNGQSASTTLEMENNGTAFQGEVIPIIPGENGWLTQERVTATRDSAVAKPLPAVPEGCKYLYVSAHSASDPGADLDLYLYHFDETQQKWVEVGLEREKKLAGAELVVESPEPGQYVAYIEASGFPSNETEFTWTALAAKALPILNSGGGSTGQEVFEWKEKSKTTISLRLSASVLDKCFSLNNGSSSWEGSGLAYVTIWDKGSGLLRDIVPVAVYPNPSTPLVYIGTGASGNGKSVVTLEAWDPITWKPLNALVSLGDVWYQLEGGEATVVLNGSTINDLRISSYYPSMAPFRKVIAK